MKVIQKHKFTVFVILVYMAVVVLGFVIYNQSNSDLYYGDRLDGIEDVPIEESQYDDLEKELKENKYVSNMTHHLSGKTLNVIITVVADTSLSNAKKIGSMVLTGLTEEQLSFYDVQVFIKEDVLVFETGMTIEEFAVLLDTTEKEVKEQLKALEVEVKEDFVLDFKTANKVAKKLEKTIKDEEAMSFPIIGYKKTTSTKLYWTKDR